MVFLNKEYNLKKERRNWLTVWILYLYRLRSDVPTLNLNLLVRKKCNLIDLSQSYELLQTYKSIVPFHKLHEYKSQKDIDYTIIEIRNASYNEIMGQITISEGRIRIEKLKSHYKNYHNQNW